MSKFVFSLLFIFILSIVESKSQSINIDFAAAANTLIKNDSTHLPILKIALMVDSFSISNSTVNLYLNKQKKEVKLIIQKLLKKCFGF